MRSPNIVLLFLAGLIFYSCTHPASKQKAKNQIMIKEGFVENQNVKLQYLDWGGGGDVLILITGIGDTPFIFDSLARELSDRFHVIGYSRRDHGKSVAKDGRYDNAALVSDLKLLFDSLKIEKASLLGWSMGGNEITGFASLYPDRVSKLIYFEAGYDMTDKRFAALASGVPASYLPDPSVMRSLDSYRDWYHKIWFGDIAWNHSLELNLLATVHIKPDGSVQSVPADRTFETILNEAMSYDRNYENVGAASLVIFTQPFFHQLDSDKESSMLMDSIERNIVVPWRNDSRERIGKELVNSVIVDAPGGSHTSCLFASHEFLVQHFSDFLAERE